MRPRKLVYSLILILLMVQGIKAFNQVEAKPMLRKLGEIDLQQSVSNIYGGTAIQTRVLWSNYTQRWYVFYVNDQDWVDGIQYAVFTASGVCESFNNTFLTADVQHQYKHNVQDWDIDIDKYGIKIYLVYAINSAYPANNNGKASLACDMLFWRYYAVNPSSKLIDHLNSHEISADFSRTRWTVPTIRINYGQKEYQVIHFSNYGTSYAGTIIANNETTSYNLAWQISVDTLLFNEMGWNRGDTASKPSTVDFLNKNGEVLFVQQTFQGTPNLWQDSYLLCWDIIEQVDQYIGGGADYNATLWQGSRDAGNDYHELPSLWYVGFTGSGYPAPNSDAFGAQLLNQKTEGWLALSNRTAGTVVDQENDVLTGVVGRAMGFGIATRNNMSIVYMMNDTKEMFLVPYDDNSFDVAAPYGDWNYTEKYSIYNFTNDWLQDYPIASYMGNFDNWDKHIGSSRRAWAQGGIGVESVTMTFAISIIPQNLGGDTLELYVLDFGDSFSDAAPSLPPTIDNVTITDSGGTVVEWLKEGEIYHLIFDTNNTEWGYIEFTDNDDLYRFYFNETTNRVWLDQGTHEFKGTVVAFVRTETLGSTGDNWDITFTLARNIDDSIDIDFTYFVINHWHNETATGDFATGLNIYNLGGFTMGRYILNDAGFDPFGNPLEVYAQYNVSSSWANTSQVYRKIQLYHSQFALDVSDNDVFDSLENTGDFQVGWQYYNESSQEWYDIAYVNVDINTGAVDPAGAGAGKAWVNFQYAWYARNAAGNMAIAKSGFFVGYPDCGDDKTNPLTTSQFWVDLWLDRANNSRVIGGNINPYYFGMDETGWLFFTSWRPIMVNETFGEFQAPLRAFNGTIMQADEMDLMRITTLMLCGVAGDTNEWSITDFKNQDILLAQNRLIGIDKPALVETLTIEMASSGFLSGLRKAIQGIGAAIASALAGVWKTTIGAVDTILSFLGLPEGTFSSIIAVIVGLLNVVEVVLANFDELITHLVASITNYILLIVTTAGRIIYFADMLVSTIIQFWTQLVSLFTGGWENVGNIWANYDIVAFVQLWLIAFFPFWEIERISNSENPMGVIKDDVGFIIGILTAVIDAFGVMFSFVRDAFDFIRNVIL